MLRLARFLAHFVLLFGLLPLMAYSHQSSLPYQIKRVNIEEKKESRPLLSYDNIIHLLEQIESGDLEQKCSLEEWERVNTFIAFLAREGVLPDGSEESFSLEEDVEELLRQEEVFPLAGQGKYLIVPAVFTGYGETLLCKSWAKKQWHQTKKFVKKHKKAIIIGAAVVVIAVGVGIAVAASSAAAAAAAESDTSKSKEKEPSTASGESTSTEAVVPDVPDIKSLVEDQIFTFKENIAQEQLFQTPDNVSVQGGLSLEENGRTLGSIFAHDSLHNLNAGNLPSTESYSSPVYVGHLEIDKLFATNYSPLFTNLGQPIDFNTLSYQVRGSEALQGGYFTQAVQDLGKAIQLDPTNPLPYLQRGFAHFSLGEYDLSIEDFNQYASQTDPIIPLSIPDFSLGFAKGLPKGIYDSGSGLFLFVSDLVTHPIRTSQQMWDALTLLSTLVKSAEWSALSQAVAPEIHQLIVEWDTLPSDVRGELAGYAFGKYGADIVIPGVLAKAIANGIKGAQEIAVVYKNLQTAEQTLVLESVVSLENGAKVGQVVQSTQNILHLGEELGFSTYEMGQLKKVGSLEETVASAYEKSLADAIMGDNGWCLPKHGGGVSINGRWYTEHALERMAPNTPEVMAELEARALKRAYAKGLEPGTREFEDWWLVDGPNPRGIPPMVVEAEISTPGSTNIQVIMNKNGDVVTVIPREI